ncbi:MAG: hypothetical protein APR62_08950 [Smithella sp. SDB]|nr:MAG: hypothetical protein APR62_08950 [Smithella sp. SDB]
MKKDKNPGIIYAIILLFIYCLFWMPAITFAEQTPLEKNASENADSAQMEKTTPERTSGEQIGKIPQKETVGDQIKKNLPESNPDDEFTGPESENQTQFQKIKNYFSADLRILTYGIVQEPAETSQNPDNNLMQYPQYIVVAEIRPDLRFDSKFLELAFKPRAKFDFKSWREGALKYETKSDDEWYVNEWLVRLKVLEKIFASYGRENLQWGPSFIYSPSNPFFSDNGRSNPFMEVPGMDFVRLIVIPHSIWTISFIVNTDEGRNTLLGTDPFKTSVAAKIDFTGRKNYASIIFSDRDSKFTTGFFGGWTISDAILLYGEGSVTQGSRALYPVKDASLLGASMQKIYNDDSEINPILLAGTSYTFANSGTLSLEYLYNDLGYNNQEADLYYFLRKNAANAFEAGGAASLLGQTVLYQTANPGLRFLRRNYVMLQYNQTNIRNKLGITFRWTQNIDDGSGQFLGLLSYSVGEHWELFSSGIVNAGPGDTEFGSTLSYQIMFGMKWVL